MYPQMSPKTTDPHRRDEPLFECFDCGRRETDPDGRLCEDCGGYMRNIAVARDQ